MVGEETGHIFFLRLHRIALDDAPAASADVVGRRPQECRRDAAAAVALVDEEADHRPHLLRVDGLEDARALEPRKLLTRGDGAPADGPPAVVGEDAGDGAGFDDPPHRPAVGLTLAGLELTVRQAPPHAPAAARRAVGAEERLEVVPAVRRQGVALELRVSAAVGDVFHVDRIAQGRRPRGQS